MMMRILALSVAAFAAAIGFSSLTQATSPSAAAKGKLVFLRCASCHSITSGGGARIGPNLQGVVGRKAGSLAGAPYSAAMKQQSFVWTDAMLDRWLTRPAAVVPGTTMAFGGLDKPEDRADVIAYLKSTRK